MPVVTKLPKGMKEHDLQRNSPEKQLGVKTPPIQFIPTRPPKAHSQEDCATVKITFPSKVVKIYQVFFNSDLEQAISHVRLMEFILKDLRIVELIAASEAEIKEK